MKDERALSGTTIFLFDENAYLREFTAKVTSCEPEQQGYRVCLDRTAFFPEGGGQKSDSGFLNTVRVSEVKTIDGETYHFTEQALEVGETVCGRIDWEKRFVRMQNHTGEHLVSGLIHTLFRFDNVGFHLGDDIVTVDTNGILTAEDFKVITERANRAVTENIAIEVDVLPAGEIVEEEYRSKLDFDGDVRLVTIPGYDCCACCAPHVKTTGEIGVIEILSYEGHRGGTRFFMLCGQPALEDIMQKLENNSRISGMLSAKPCDTADAVNRLMQQYEEQKFKSSELKRQIVTIKIESVLKDLMQDSSKQNCIFFEDEFDEVMMRTLLNAVVEHIEGIACGFFLNPSGGYRYIFACKNKDAREFAKAFNTCFGARGGGSPAMVQGTVNAQKKELENYMESNLKRKVTTIIFDLDGTLLNTLEDLSDSVNHVLLRHGLPTVTIEQMRGYVGNGVQRMMERAINGQTSAEEQSQMTKEFKEYYEEHSLDKTAPYPGIIKMLSTLKDQGYKMAIVSNKFQEGVNKLKEVFFKQELSVAIGESETVRKKPAPDSVIEALKQLDSKPFEAVYIGDSEVDFATATNSGLSFLGVTWGFRDIEVLEQLGATDFVNHPSEIAGVLTK